MARIIIRVEVQPDLPPQREPTYRCYHESFTDTQWHGDNGMRMMRVRDAVTRLVNDAHEDEEQHRHKAGPKGVLP